MLSEEVREENTAQFEFMTFRIGKERFGIGIDCVDEIVAIQPITIIPEVPDYVKGLINLRGKIIPVIDVRIKFGMEPVPYTDRTCIIVIHEGTTAVGLIVEKITEVFAVAEGDIISLPEAREHRDLQGSEYVYGLAKAEGRVILLLRLEKLIETEGTETPEEVPEETAEEE